MAVPSLGLRHASPLTFHPTCPIRAASALSLHSPGFLGCQGDGRLARKAPGSRVMTPHSLGFLVQLKQTRLFLPRSGAQS